MTSKTKKAKKANKAYLCSDKELYLVINDEYGTSYYNIRPVSTELLEKLQSLEGCKAYNKEIWVEAVRHGDCEDSLNDFCQELLDSCDGDEEYPFKDDSFTQYLDYINPKTKNTLREDVDAKMLELFDYQVGTWECSGCGCTNFKKNYKVLAIFTF